jgi:hypothetical protein
MSKRVLLTGVEARLKVAFGIASNDIKHIGVQPTGQPPPHAGQWYIAIFPGARTNNDSNPLSLDETYSIGVTVTMRMGYAPKDRQGQRIIMDANDGILAIADKVRAAIHGNYDILTVANAAIPGTNGFIEPLSFQGDSSILEKSPDWVFAEGDDNPPTTFAVELRFGGARRIQTLESQA